MPQSIAGIREVLGRDRRDKERRWGKRDSRVFRHNRRGDDRRFPRGSDARVDEDMIIEISELVSDLDLLSLEGSGRSQVGPSQSDLTSIQQRPELGEQ